MQYMFAILDEVHRLYRVGVVIEGEARGADQAAWQWAIQRGVPTAEFPADWETHGKAAGPIRNKQMLKEGKPDMIIAFHKHFEESRGTKNMITQAKKAKIEFMVFPMVTLHDDKKVKMNLDRDLEILREIHAESQ
jgi:hypothetical protein